MKTKNHNLLLFVETLEMYSIRTQKLSLFICVSIYLSITSFFFIFFLFFDRIYIKKDTKVSKCFVPCEQLLLASEVRAVATKVT